MTVQTQHGLEFDGANIQRVNQDSGLTWLLKTEPKVTALILKVSELFREQPRYSIFITNSGLEERET